MTFVQRTAETVDLSHLTNTTLNTLGRTATTKTNPVPAVGYNSLAVYPNPANNSFNAIINSDQACNANLKVADVTGKVLIAKTIALQKGNQSMPTDVNTLTPGLYFVTLTENGQLQTQKLVIMK